MLYILSEFLFVDLLLIHFLSLLFHDYVNLYPLNDVENIRQSTPALKRIIMTLLNSAPALAALIIAILYFGEWKPFEIRFLMFAYFFIRGVAIYFKWYNPYLFGASEKRKLKFQVKFGRTHQILPVINDNPRPNSLHFILHLLFFINFILLLICGYNPVGII